jgi:hypothetical protein
VSAATGLRRAAVVGTVADLAAQVGLRVLQTSLGRLDRHQIQPRDLLVGGGQLSELRSGSGSREVAGGQRMRGHHVCHVNSGTDQVNGPDDRDLCWLRRSTEEPWHRWILCHQRQLLSAHGSRVKR